MTGPDVMATRLQGVADELVSRDDGIVSVVMPVVERTGEMLSVYEAFAEVLEKLGREYEFIFVFDGSVGAPPPGLLGRAREDPRVRVLTFQQAFGETAALRAGIENSRGKIVATVPAYFQVRPEGIDALLAALESGADLAVSRRFPRLDGWFNRMQSRVFHALVNGVSHVSFHDIACGVRVMRREVAEAIPLYGDLHRFIPALAVREGFVVKEVEVAQHPADARTRLYRPGIYLRRVLDIIAYFFLAKFTEKPLRFFGLVGVFMAGVGGLLSFVLLLQRIAGQGIANRPLLLLAVLLITLGTQIVGLGLVAEVIVRLRSPRQRSYRVREIV